jgi:hypothetical protein
VLTSIDASGVKQTTMHVWNEDEVGWPIWPLPIDWKAWKAARLQQCVPGTKAAVHMENAITARCRQLDNSTPSH